MKSHRTTGSEHNQGISDQRSRTRSAVSEPPVEGRSPILHLLRSARPHLQSLAESLSGLPHAVRLFDAEESLLQGEVAPHIQDAVTERAEIHTGSGLRLGIIEVVLPPECPRPLAAGLAAHLARSIERDLTVSHIARQRELLRALELLTQAELSHVQLDQLLQDVLLRLQELLQVDTCAVLLSLEDREPSTVDRRPSTALQVRAAVGLERETAVGVVVPAGRGVAGLIAASEGPVILDDLSQVDVFSPVLREKVCSLMGARLVADGNVMGVVHVGSTRPRQFSDAEANQLQVIASRLALAIVHARMHQAEEAARSEAQRAQRRFQDLVENINAIAWEADAETWRYTYVSRQAENILGYPVERWLQEPEFWVRLLHPDDLARVVARRRDAIAARRASSMEYRVRAADGHVVWVRSLFDVVCDPAGRPRQIRGLLLDVSQRRKDEDSALRLAAIVESTEDAIIGKDLDGIVTNWNSGAEKMYGYPAAEVVGRHISLLSVPGRESEFDDIMRKLRGGEHILHSHARRMRKDGEVLDVALTISPIRNSQGDIIGASTIARDITESKRAEQTLRLTEKLAATGRLAASIAHEINNPMASVTNLLYLLQHHPTLDPAGRQYVTLAQEELERITHIVRQMLGFYREADRPVEVSLKDVLENVLLLYARKIRAAHIEVHRQYAQDGLVQAFPGEVRQVFSNLIVNAIDAVGAGGELAVRVRRGRDWGHPGRQGVRVIIADNGPGIRPEHRRRVFEPFFTTKGERGTGLGLWVSEGIIRKHGGAIRVRTSNRPERHGTCFSVFLPEEAETRPHEVPRSRPGADWMQRKIA